MHVQYEGPESEDEKKIVCSKKSLLIQYLEKDAKVSFLFFFQKWKNEAYGHSSFFQ